MRTNDITSLFQQPSRNITKDGAHYGTPYQHGETPLGENLEQNGIPTSIRKNFRQHPDIEALSLLPDSDAYLCLINDIDATIGILLDICPKAMDTMSSYHHCTDSPCFIRTIRQTGLPLAHLVQLTDPGL